MQDGRPESYHVASDFTRIIAASESNIAILQRRRRRNRNVVRGPITTQATWQPIYSFAEQVLRAGTRHPRIAQKVVHGRHSGRTENPQPGHLNRGRLHREKEVSRARRMPRQVDQDIDSIRADAFRESNIRDLSGYEVFGAVAHKVSDGVRFGAD